MVRPATSTFGIPGAASTQCVVPAGSIETPKSDAAYTSPVTSSSATSLAGRSPQSYERSVQVEVPNAGLYVTSNRCPGVAGVFALYPLYEIQAWFPFFGSTKIELTNRFGVTVSSSIRVHETALAGSASTFLET